MNISKYMNQYQIDWCIAKAKKDTLKEEQLQAERDRNDLAYAKIGHQYLDAIVDFKVATARLLTFARTFVAQKYAGKADLSDVLKLYDDDISNYCMVDMLPDWWQSKLVLSTLRTNFKN